MNFSVTLYHGLKEAAIDCEFSVKCSKQGCGTTISYAEDMVRDQAVYG